MPAAPGITTAPQLVGRQQGGFVGYYSEGGNWYPVDCPSSERLTQSKSFFACCASSATSFGIATACIQGSVLPNPTDTYTCNGNCCSIALFSGLNDQNPYMAYACGVCRSTLYREIPSTQGLASTNLASTSSGSSGSSTTPTSSSSSATPTSSITIGLPISPSSAPSAVVSTPSANSTDSSDANRAWIAGAVVGPVAAAAIIAGLAFWIWKLRNRPANVKESIVYLDPSGRAELGPQGSSRPFRAQLVEAPDQRQLIEAPEQHQLVEAPTQPQVLELPTSDKEK